MNPGRKLISGQNMKAQFFIATLWYFCQANLEFLISDLSWKGWDLWGAFLIRLKQ